MTSVFMKNRAWSAQTQCGINVHGQQEYELLSCHVGTIYQERRMTVCYDEVCYDTMFYAMNDYDPWFELDWTGCLNYSMLNGLFHGLSWYGLAAFNHSMVMYHSKQPNGNT
ncbi:hypothetical protein TIFTF001_041998 [Ficus carica]|uniref:Uncharacterized protein n=1 Tax=Ficus carica TaxID=3494 RepID=A0AA87ZGD9_FICCA|nr:hypothetical protein TIFTF001_041998 [Ficus carica]